MAATRKAYPAIPTHVWWTLRQKFIQSYPREVTRDYLKSALGLGDKVSQNIHPPLKVLGLVDDENHPTDLAEKWRDDDRYADATREMIDAVYPQALRDASPPENPDLAAATRWFLNDTKSGSARAKQLATFYVLLARGDVADTAGGRPRRAALGGASSATPRRQASERSAKHTKVKDDSDVDAERNGNRVTHPAPPVLSVAVQVYVDKDMTAEQVDHVFASMAKHLYGKE